MAVLRTPRLRLEPQGPEFFDPMWKAIESSLPELREWLVWAVEPDPAETKHYLELAATEWASGLERHFVILQDDEVAGSISLQHVVPRFERAEVGYWMRTDLCGRGLMTEAGSAAVAYGFEQMGLHRLELHAAPGNTGSVRVAEKLGFTKEGTLRHGGKAAGGFQDVDVFGLLATDARPTYHLQA